MQTLFKLSVPMLLLWTGLMSPAHSEDAWKVLLEQQLLAEEKCQLTFLTNLSIKEEDGGKSITAKAHCEDNRSFDVHMPHGRPKFDLSACKPTYC